MEILDWLKKADKWVARQRLPRIRYREDLTWIKPILRQLPLILLIPLGFGIIVYVAHWLLFVGPRPWLANPELQRDIATAAPTRTARSLQDPWSDHTWLTQGEARALQQQPGVVNLAMLKDGGVRYSASSSITFNPEVGWKQTRPFGITELTVEGTAVTLHAHGNTYHLNVLQPFVFESRPQRIYIIDLTGQLWETVLTDVDLNPIDSVRDALPVEIEPNPQLNLTFRR